jgi:hypothetical protein
VAEIQRLERRGLGTREIAEELLGLAPRCDSGRMQVHDRHGDRLPEDVRRAELDDLRSRIVEGCVAGRDVVGIAGLLGLLAVREPEGHLPLDHVAPARELAAVVRQPAEEVPEVGIRCV